MKICKPGTPRQQLTVVCREVINSGLVELGIIKSETEKHMYFPHGVSHHIGLDVHDRGGPNLEENNTVTIEPGTARETLPKFILSRNRGHPGLWVGIGARMA